MADKTDVDVARNHLRCVAAEVIVKLYEAKDVEQLKLLKSQIQRSLEFIAREARPVSARRRQILNGE